MLLLNNKITYKLVYRYALQHIFMYCSIINVALTYLREYLFAYYYNLFSRSILNIW